MAWEANIKKVENGYITKWLEETEFENTNGENVRTWIEKECVFQFGENTEGSELEQADFVAFREVILWLMDHFGVVNSKHNKFKLEIKIVEQKPE